MHKGEQKAEVRAVNKDLFKVKIEHEVTPQQICNLLVTAFDGYFTKQWLACEEVHMPRVPDWSWCSEEEREEWEAARKIYVAAMCGGTVSFIDRVENDDPDESPNLLIMDKQSLIRGLKIMAEKYPRHFQDFIREKDDDITGDIYVQCCLLDEAPYGSGEKKWQSYKSDSRPLTQFTTHSKTSTKRNATQQRVLRQSGSSTENAATSRSIPRPVKPRLFQSNETPTRD